MIIRPYESLFRCLVQSESDPETWHLVDLESYFGNGWCACQWFQFNLEPELCTKRKVHGDTYRCKHIMAARQKLGLELLDTLIEQRNQCLQDLRKRKLSGARPSPSRSKRAAGRG